MFETQNPLGTGRATRTGCAFDSCCTGDTGCVCTAPVTPPAATPPAVEGLGARGAVAAAVAARAAADAAEARLLVIAAHWADLHPVLGGDPDGFAVAGMERLVPLAGPGTPLVAEFAPAELAAALGMTTHAGQGLVGDALELRHRLPRLWARIQDGTLPAWRGRRVAEHTRTLPGAGAAWVDAQLAGFAHKIGLARVQAAIEAALIRFDPAAAAAAAAAAEQTRGVWLDEKIRSDGTRGIRIEADALDATAFEATITSIADALAGLGDPDHTDQRRAKAVGVIADPQTTLDLLTTPTHPDPNPNSDGPGDGQPGDGEPAGVPTGAGAPAGAAGAAGAGVKRRTGKPKVTLYLHLHQEAITSRAGLGRVEGLGPVLADQIRDWVGRSEVTIKPVLDLEDRVSVDAYEVPDRIVETVIIRNPCCPFPWCNNLSRTKDIDHIDPYLSPDQGGPPGQSAAHKLAPLCRRHHRLKTHGDWAYTMPEPGIYLWRSPAGRRYLVDHTGTAALPHTA